LKPVWSGGTRPDLSLDTWGREVDASPRSPHLFYFLIIRIRIFSYSTLVAPTLSIGNERISIFHPKQKQVFWNVQFELICLHVPGIHYGTLTLKLLIAMFEKLEQTSQGWSAQYNTRFAHVEDLNKKQIHEIIFCRYRNLLKNVSNKLSLRNIVPNSNSVHQFSDLVSSWELSNSKLTLNVLTLDFWIYLLVLPSVPVTPSWQCYA